MEGTGEIGDAASAAGAADRAPQELRIHGVGGSPGPGLLGLDSEDDAVLVAEGIGTSFTARRADPRVEGYDWGRLTSGSSLQPLWVLLLPFTLLNVAGWMHPPPDRAFRFQIPAIRFIVRLLGIAMTVSFALWFAVVLVDIVGYQWTRRLTGIDWIQRQEIGGWKLVSGGDVQPIQVVGMVLGGLLTALAMFGVDRIADNTQKEFERTPLSPHVDLPPEAERKDWGGDEDLTSTTFFAHAPAAHRRLWHHRWALIAVGVFVAFQALGEAGEGGANLHLGQGLFVLGAVEFLAVLLLGVVSFRTGAAAGTRAVRCGPAVAAVLAFAVAHAFFSGLILFATRWLNERPSLEGDALPPVQGGLELALTDVWSVLVALGVAAAFFWLRRQKKRGEADDLPRRTSGAGQPLDGVTDGWRREVAKARGYSVAGHRAPWLFTGLALTFFLVSLGFALRRLSRGGSWNPTDWTLAVDPGGGLWDVAAWLLPAALAAAVATVWKATKSTALRRTIGILWDVLTFWPRRFHPLAVRPYSERAVPEFQGRILEHVAGDGRPVVLSAHSQGSTLAFAALAPLDDDVLGRVALVTFGSPIGGLYGLLFPAYYGPDQVTTLEGKLLHGDARGWRNFYRLTDPIGGPVLGDADREVEIPDPATESRTDEGPEVPGPERDRPAWATIAGHSKYQRERILKSWVAALKQPDGPLGQLTETRDPPPPSS